MSQMAINGGITLAVIFALIVLSVLGWRYPHTIGNRLAIGIFLGLIGVGAFIYMSESVSVFVTESGLAKTVADVQKQ